MTSCSHIQSASIRAPGPNDPVYREDCTLCFDSTLDDGGLDVCMTCFNGGCAGSRNHSHLHAIQAQHPLAVNIKKTRKRKHSDEPPKKLSKLAISAETDADRYETITTVRCLECGIVEVERTSKIDQVVNGILKANTFAQQEEVKAWELELTSCEHILCLEQSPGRSIASSDLGHCGQCDLKENLWLCLTCGNLGCGRKQYGGAGPAGNGHQLEHNQSTGHPVAVKLGSITAEGNADIYCYACDEERIDTELVAHLAHWGIDIANRVKTEKSMTEMQLEQNMTYDFSMTTADGDLMKPLFGPGLTGLKNLGNSCYLNSVLQALFTNQEFVNRYYRPEEDVAAAGKPAEDIETQLRKLADGLLSGRYAKPDDTEGVWQAGIAPSMFKHLIGRGHAEFSTMRQQDSFELLLHILKLITRSQQSAQAQYKDITDPVDAFRFVLEQKLQCLSCKKVRYRQDEMENLSVAVPIKRIKQDDTMVNGHAEKEEFEPVTLQQCLDDFTAPEVVELDCSSCGSKGFTKQSLFKTFPTILAVNARRFEIVNWVPTKQDVPVLVGDGIHDLERYRSKGKQADEEELLEVDAPKGFQPNALALDSLMGMGFPQVRCEKALQATGNADAEVAAAWLFEHMDDADIDTPLETTSDNSAVDPEKIEGLQGMGFSAPQARQALKETGGDMERAVDWLFSHPDAEGDFGTDAAEPAVPKAEMPDTEPATFQLKSIVCHKGSSIHAGHYVAFVKKPIDAGKEEWVLFNDEKVAQGGDGDEMIKHAYIYFFRRTTS